MHRVFQILAKNKQAAAQYASSHITRHDMRASCMIVPQCQVTIERLPATSQGRDTDNPFLQALPSDDGKRKYMCIAHADLVAKSISNMHAPMHTCSSALPVPLALCGMHTDMTKSTPIIGEGATHCCQQKEEPSFSLMLGANLFPLCCKTLPNRARCPSHAVT